MPDVPKGWPIHPATRWLVKQYTGPSTNLHARWQDPGVLSFPLGKSFDAILVTLHLGRAAVEVMQRAGDGLGPVIESSREARLMFLVPPGTARSWNYPLTSALGEGESVFCPEPGQTACNRFWLAEPDPRGTLTDPARLLMALIEAGQDLFSKTATKAG
ncbi:MULTISPECIES: hypothetical protein [Streptacidiphilus]|uniref:DNA primase/polymerase bifunctional N-terminal domain-containing protein n=1 Tax=Streptacidiphilus cavernicola TaxID=3342716 RepID=A0ABV6UXG3_9ACTN|nr:hypothetical protein [Streptacidiphilus jeojiense]